MLVQFGMLPGGALSPGIVLAEALRMEEAGAQRFAAGKGRHGNFEDI